MTKRNWPYLWTVRGRYGRRVIVQADLVGPDRFRYETVDADGFTDGGGYVTREGLESMLAYLARDYPSLRGEE